MINLDALCAELTTALPAAGWPLRHPLKSMMPRHGTRCASASWDGPHDTGIAIQLYQRDQSPVLIVWDGQHSSGTAEPHTYNAAAIIATLDNCRWVVQET